MAAGTWDAQGYTPAERRAARRLAPVLATLLLLALPALAGAQMVPRPLWAPGLPTDAVVFVPALAPRCPTGPVEAGTWYLGRVTVDPGPCVTCEVWSEAGNRHDSIWDSDFRRGVS